MSTLTLPPLDNPEGYLRVEIAGQEPFLLPFMDYVTVDQVTEILDLYDGLQNAESQQAQMAATVNLLKALGLTIVQSLPTAHLVAIMRAWQEGPGDLGESGGSVTTSASEPIAEPSNTSSSEPVSDSAMSDEDDLLEF